MHNRRVNHTETRCRRHRGVEGDQLRQMVFGTSPGPGRGDAPGERSPVLRAGDTVATLRRAGNVALCEHVPFEDTRGNGPTRSGSASARLLPVYTLLDEASGQRGVGAQVSLGCSRSAFDARALPARAQAILRERGAYSRPANGRPVGAALLQPGGSRILLPRPRRRVFGVFLV